MGLFGTYNEEPTESKALFVAYIKIVPLCILVFKRFVPRAFLREGISLFYF